MRGSLNIHIAPSDVQPLVERAQTLPARPGVIAFEARDGSTVLLAATGDLRRFALTRLGQGDETTPARRENLAPVTAALRARVVGSSFEGDALYLEEARERLPATYRSALDTRRVWAVRLDPGARTPVWRKLDLLAASGQGETLEPSTLIAPFGDKDNPGRYAERLDDLFDLCRTPRELELAPNGRACAYKEMGRCDAPCDGSASMEAYRARVRDAVRFAAQPVELSLSAIDQRMARAAGEQDFELAAQLRSRAERIRKGRKPGAAWATTLDRFAVLGAFPSVRRARVSLFIATASAIEHWADVGGDLTRACARELLPRITGRAEDLLPRTPLGVSACERLAMLTHHLYHPRRGAGELIALGPSTDAAQLCTLVRRAGRLEPAAMSDTPDTQLGPRA